MRNFIKYLGAVAAPTLCLGLLLCIWFSGSVPTIADVVCTGMENIFSFIQNETVRNAVIIVLMLLVYTGLRWVFFKLATRKSGE